MRKLSRKNSSKVNKKAKFRVGQIVVTTHSLQPKKIIELNWRLKGSSGRESYLYSMHDGTVYWESVLRAQTARERSKKERES